MKFFVLLLLVLLFALQYALWSKQGGLLDYWQLQRSIKQATLINAQWQQQNQQLVASIEGLQIGESSLEQLAREQLGMIKQGETYYQIQHNQKAGI